MPNVFLAHNITKRKENDIKKRHKEGERDIKYGKKERVRVMQRVQERQRQTEKTMTDRENNDSQRKQ